MPSSIVNTKNGEPKGPRPFLEVESETRNQIAIFLLSKVSQTTKNQYPHHFYKWRVYLGRSVVMDYQYILEKVSDIAFRVSLLIAFVGLAKVFLINYFLYKITMAKKSEIKFTREGKSASYSNYEDNAEKVINIYKNLGGDDDFTNKAS